MNCSLDVASTQVASEQLLHVDGHIVLTPSNLHRRLVDLVATHTQLLDIILPSFLTLNLNGESTHDVVVGVGAVGVMGVGAVGVGAVGVGAVGVGAVGVGAVGVGAVGVGAVGVGAVGVGAVGVGGVGVGGVGVGGVGVGAVGVGAVGGGRTVSNNSHPLAHASCPQSFMKLSSVGQPHLAEPQHLSTPK